MNNNVSIWETRRVVKPWIMIIQYDASTPLGKKEQEGPPPLPTYLWWDGRPEHCRDVNLRLLTSWRGSTEKMEIVSLPGSTILSLWPFQSFIFSFLTYFFHSETVALIACPYWDSESLSFHQASAQKILTVPPDPWSWIEKSRSYPIIFSNASHQPLFSRCAWFEVCH